MVEKNILNCKLINESIIDHKSNVKYDRILNGFGLGYLLENDTLNKLHQKLNENGKLCLSVWTHQLDQDWLTSLVNKYLNIETKDSNKNVLSTEEGIYDLFENTKFSFVSIKRISKKFTFVNEDQWWNDMMNTAVRNIIEAIERESNLEEFKKEAFKDVDGISFIREAMIIICEK